MLKLYIYEHCPFCAKADMVFGLTQTTYDRNIMMEGDVQTPTMMVGKKMVPILRKYDGSYMGESSDIVDFVYESSSFPKPHTLSQAQKKEVQSLIDEGWDLALPLVIPRFTLGDFKELSTPFARAAYTHREERAFGDLHLQIRNTQSYLPAMKTYLKRVDSFLERRRGVDMTDYDLYPLLRSLTIVKELEFPKNVMSYLKELEEKSGVALLFDALD